MSYYVTVLRENPHLDAAWKDRVGRKEGYRGDRKEELGVVGGRYPLTWKRTEEMDQVKMTGK